MNMFNIQREIFTKVANEVLASYPACRIVNAFVYVPPAFPCVAFVLSDDDMTEDTSDSSKADNYRDVTATVDVYSNKADGKKTEAEAIAQIVIDTLTPLNFKMRSCRPSSNLNNATTYRITAIFTATVDANGTIYKRR